MQSGVDEDDQVKYDLRKQVVLVYIKILVINEMLLEVQCAMVIILV
jgi:hypothetical protein